MPHKLAANKKATYRDFDIDFTIHPLSGDIVKVVDDNAIKQSIETLLSLEYFETPMQPEKGCNVTRLLFEPMGIDTALEIEDAIREVIDKYEPRITVEEIQITPDYDNATYDVKIIFKILNNIDLSVIDFVLERVN